MPEREVLRQYQALPLGAKVSMSLARIREWYDHWNGNVFVSFSGGKDSTVLAHIVREFYPDVPLVFVNTGLEYPEIQTFARKMGATFLRPKMQFSEVISKYGYPIISKENAEAIYYARKIKIGGGGTEERKRNELAGSRIDKPLQRENRMEKSGDTREAAVNTGKETERRRADITANRNQWDANRGEWAEWRRRSIAGVGSFSEDSKSIFNKEKWLPLCRDTQFKISHQCCSVMKKSPIGIYQRRNKVVPIVGTLAEESRMREQAWIRHGCNAFEGSKAKSQPMSFWLEQDVLQYIVEEGIEIASVYGDILTIDGSGMEYSNTLAPCGKLQCSGCQRTGCIFCAFGVHLEKGETRFQRLAKTHPKQYEYCMRGGQWVDNPDYDPTAPKIDGQWENWNPKKIWVPSKEGLGMKKVFDDCNQIYGKDFIKYE